MKTYTLHHVGLWSLLKIGFLISWIVSFLPVALLTVFSMRAIAALTAWLAGLIYQVRLPLPGNFGFDLNLVELLKLQGLIDKLNGWVVAGFIPLLLVILLLTSLFALMGGLVTALGGLVFNLFSHLSGGVEVALSEQDADSRVVSVIPPGVKSTSDDQ